MYIHLGEDVVIQSKEIIAILDYQVYQSSPINEELLEKYQPQTIMSKIGNESTKSIVLTSEKVYLSPLAPNTLKKRSEYIDDFDTSLEEQLD